jgi:hypothetical protein
MDSFTVYKETPSTDGTYIQSIVDDTLGAVWTIAVDGAGNVYVGRGGIGVEKEILSGNTYTRSEIFYTFYADDIGVDAEGNLYIADGSGSGIRKETPSGNGYTESIIASGQDVSRMALDSLGNIYYLDNGQIQKLTPNGGGYQQTTAASGLAASASGIAIDALGNLYFSTYDSQSRDGNVWKVNSAEPPSLSFATTSFGMTSADSPQIVSVANIGNADLNLPVPSSGTNPSIAASFILNDNATSACPQIKAGASSTGILAPGSFCDLSISFVPSAAGPINGSLVLMDNALNATTPSYATQTITLSGTGVGTKFTPAMSFASSAGSIFVSNPLTFTATLTANSGTPTGTATFYDGNTPLGTGSLNGGIAVYTTSALGAGSHSITATYSGDTNFNALTSAAISETIEDFTIAVFNGSPSSATVSAGGQASYTLSVAPSGNTKTAAAITLAVSGLPSGATSSFSPSTIAANSAATGVTLTVTASSTARAEPVMRAIRIPIELGVFLLAALGRSRRGSRKLREFSAALLLGLAGMAGLATLTACGGTGRSSSGGGGTGTTPQNYTITVTAASGALSHRTTLTLTVK